MALNIRNPRAEQLAREIASICGENLTQATIRALEQRLEGLRGRRTATDLLQEIMKISERCSALPDQDRRTPEEILGYNETGTLGKW